MEKIFQTQSIALVADLPSAESLTKKIFHSFYSMVDKSLKSNFQVEYHLGLILSQLTFELETLPAQTVDIILSHFLTKAPASLLKDNQSLNVESPGYMLSKTICQDNIDIMTRHVNQYFADILSGSFFDDEEGGEKEEKPDLLANQKKLLNLAEQLWQAVPELVTSIMGQLEQGLLVEDDEFRTITLVTFSRIIASPTSRVDFIKEHYSTWKSWLGRSIDKSPNVRAAWTNCLPSIIINRTDVMSEVVKSLSDRLNDPDEKVRIAACSTVGQLPVDIVIKKLNFQPLFDNLFARLRDKKSSVREAAFKVVGKLFADGYDLIDKEDETAITLFRPIPQKIFDQVYLNDSEVNELIDICLNIYIFPPNPDDDKRAKRILNIITNLDEQGRTAFNALLKRQSTLSKYLTVLVALMKDYSTSKDPSTVEQKIRKTISWFSAPFADPAKTEICLTELFEKRDDKTLKYIGAAVNPESTFHTVHKAVKELLAKYKDYKLDGMHHTIRILLYRTSFLIINRNTIKPIIELSKDRGDKMSLVIHEFLKSISAIHPALMKAHVQDLIMIIEKAEVGTRGNAETLKAATLLAEKFSEMLPQTPKFFGALIKFATEGSPEEATEAVKLIAYSKDKELYFSSLMKTVSKLDIDNPFLSTYLSSIAELITLCPDITEPEYAEIQKYVIEKILRTNKKKASDDDPDWVEDKNLDTEAQSKIISLHILVNRFIKTAGDSTNNHLLASPVFTLLSLLIKSGEVSKDHSTPSYLRSRLQLEAGILMLDCATVKEIQKLIKPTDIIKLAFLIRKNELAVRKGFIHKLMKYWSDGKIPNRFLPLVFMMAHEPDSELFHYVSTWIRARSVYNQNRSRTEKSTDILSLELAFPALIHLIAHYHELVNTTTKESITSEDPEKEKSEQLEFAKFAADYILFYLRTAASVTNLSLILYMAQRIKQFRDGVKDELSDKLYFLSEEAVIVINKFKQFKGWSVDAWPGTMGVPADIYKAMPWDPTGREVSKTIYLKDEVRIPLEEYLKKKIWKRKRNADEFGFEQEDDQDDGSNKKTAASSKPRSKPSRNNSRKQRKVATNDEDAKLTKKKPAKKSYGRSKRKSSKGEDDDAAEGDAEPAEETGPRRKSARLAGTGSSSGNRSFKETSSEEEDSFYEDEDDEEEEEEGEEEQQPQEDDKHKQNGKKDTAANTSSSRKLIDDSDDDGSLSELSYDSDLDNAADTFLD